MSYIENMMFGYPYASRYHHPIPVFYRTGHD